MKLNVKIILILFLVLAGTVTYSYAGLYVIPTVKEVCTGISVGDVAFTLDIGNFSTAGLTLGGIFPTKSGKLVKIVGVNGGGVSYYANSPFRVAPDILPAPQNGVKGPFYYLIGGNVTYAKYL